MANEANRNKVNESPALLVVDSSLLQDLLNEQRELRREIQELNFEVRSQKNMQEGWMDAEEARAYMGLGKSAFEKYLYKTAVQIPYHKLDGKKYFKREEIDQFIRLYESRVALAA